VVWESNDSPVRDGDPTVATHRFLCPSCGKRLKIDDAMLADARRRNKGAHCPTCRSAIRFAGLDESLPSRGTTATDSTGAHDRGQDADG
jgi:hypothetical protein